jgi:hypothetical protein
MKETSSMNGTQTFWTFWIMIGLITGLLGFLFIALAAGLRHAPGWSLGDALSEEAGNQPNPLPAGQKPIMVASSSRLIALLGLSVILVLFLGFGYMFIWDHFFQPDKTIDSKSVLTFLFGGATMFAPYLANQLGNAFGVLFAPPATQTGTGPTPKP